MGEHDGKGTVDLETHTVGEDRELEAQKHFEAVAKARKNLGGLAGSDLGIASPDAPKPDPRNEGSLVPAIDKTRVRPAV